MKKETKYCDRCKREIKPTKKRMVWEVVVFLINPIPLNWNEYISRCDNELCKDCYKEYKQWIKGEVKK